MPDSSWSKQLDHADIKLGRIGHFCKSASGSDHLCIKADVIGYAKFPEGVYVTLITWDSQQTVENAPRGPAYSYQWTVLVGLPNEKCDTFHLNRDCPYER